MDFMKRIVLAIVLAFVFYLGYQSALWNVDMGMTDHSNPLSPYTKVDNSYNPDCKQCKSRAQRAAAADAYERDLLEGR